MNILQAYCIELGRAVDIYEARDAYFAQGEPRGAFTFLCSDEHCRKALQPRITGVNYRKLAEEEDIYRQPHFRENPKMPHLATCMWVDRDRRARTATPPSDSGAVGRAERAKGTDVIDVFDPMDENCEAPTAGTASAGDAAAGATRGGRSHAAAAHTREGITRTRRLERFVDCHRMLAGDVDALKHAKVVLAGQAISYWNAIVSVKRLAQGEDVRRIVNGNASIKRYPSGIAIRFLSKLDRFPEAGAERTLSIWLDAEQLNGYSGAARLEKLVTAASHPGYRASVYFFGRIQPKQGRPGYEAHVDSLFNLVVKVLTSRPPQAAA